MDLLKRIEKKILKLEKKIKKKQKQIEKLRIEYNKQMISDYDFISQKKRIDDQIKAMNFKSSILEDKMMKRKSYYDEKVMKREEMRRREKKYFEWCKKFENI